MEITMMRTSTIFSCKETVSSLRHRITQPPCRIYCTGYANSRLVHSLRIEHIENRDVIDGSTKHQVLVTPSQLDRYIA